jgi:hypothetical protein
MNYVNYVNYVNSLNRIQMVKKLCFPLIQYQVLTDIEFGFMIDV